MGSLPTEAPNTRGVGKICEFQQIARYISKTAQDRPTVPAKSEYEVECALLNGDIADDLE